jgi:uncharacterized protein
MKYTLLPFRFMRYPENERLLVNEVGEYIFLKENDFAKLTSYELEPNTRTFQDLKGKHIIADSPDRIPFQIDLLATKYRTKKAYLKSFTSLHMVVVTLRCNQICNYCHASSKDISANHFDMDIEASRKVVDMIFQTPSPSIKIEFQGGEPLLNFGVVKEIVKYAEKINKKRHKSLSFVICTNLTLIDQDVLTFLKKHNVIISTSLDGPRALHDAHRIMRQGGSSYEKVIDKLKLTRSIMGAGNVSALMTTTKDSLENLNRIVDEYIELGFQGAFLRSLNPYGYAKTGHSKHVQYDIDDFVNAYKKAIDYIIKLNQQGIKFVEYFGTILLTRILTPFSTGFMDLQSPSGVGILGAIYDFNGDVYPSDECRMLAAMGDKHFRLGNVKINSYEEMFNGSLLNKIINNSCVEVIPGCHSCAYHQYCGVDPIRAYGEQKDKSYMGHMPSSEFCRKYKQIITYYMELIRRNDPKVMDVLWSWVTRRSYKEVSLQ